MRVETGSMEFGEDWRGVFIRGDDALHYQMVLGMALKSLKDGVPLDPFSTMVLKGLVDTLAAAYQHGGGEPQRLRPYPECRAGDPPPSVDDVLRDVKARQVEQWRDLGVNRQTYGQPCPHPARRGSHETYISFRECRQPDGTWDAAKAQKYCRACGAWEAYQDEMPLDNLTCSSPDRRHHSIAEQGGELVCGDCGQRQPGEPDPLV